MPRANPDADRNLLFGITALQNDFIGRDALIDALNESSRQRHRPLGPILVERGIMSGSLVDLLDRLIEARIEPHEGDASKGLASLGSVATVADDLRRSISDPDLLDSLATLAGYQGDDPFATRAPEQAGLSSFTNASEPGGPQAASGEAIRFRKVREHAHGNLGVVYIARDEELNRDVALKEIKESSADRLQSQAKFLLEAEVTGGLEHPGIVPVYGLGHHLDGRPYYAMRFIRGKSLLEAIKRFHAQDATGSDPGRRQLALQKLLRRFTDVCNAIAYAHSRGVLHRDLKPENVMVGRYGETLVVDWGLAKALGRSGESVAAEPGDPEEALPEASLSPTSTDYLEATHAGQLVGTPAYMSPEQAAGRLDLLGPASDVYGLGATLYHLIAGKHPARGETIAEVLANIQAGRIVPPRTIAPWLDPALEAICLKAMALRPSDRYQSPRGLAEDLERWIADEPVSAYREPFARRAGRWARRHRTALSIAATASTVAAVLLGVFAWQRASQLQRSEATASAILDQVDRLAVEARASGKSADWDKVIAEARRALDQLDSGGGSPSLRRLASSRLQALTLDRATVQALEEAQLLAANLKDDNYDLRGKYEAYRAAFRDHGIDVITLPTAEAARAIRSSPIAEQLIAAIDDWARFLTEPELAGRLESIVRAAETDPERLALRDLAASGDVKGLRRLCETRGERRKLGPRLRFVFNSLLRLDPEASLPLLELIRGENPADFWINHDLAAPYRLAKPPRLADASRLLTVAVALRPDSPGARINLGTVWKAQGRLDLAAEEFREAIRLNPNQPSGHLGLANTFFAERKLAQAAEEYRVALRLDPRSANAHTALGGVLYAQGKIEEAIVEHREAIRVEPNSVLAHTNLATTLQAWGKFDQAVESYRAAIRIDPTLGTPHLGLGISLEALGQRDQALEEYRQSIRLDPNLVEAHINLGNQLSQRGQIDLALAEYREAIRLRPTDFSAHYNYARALGTQGNLDLAAKEYQETIRLQPGYAEAHCNLGAIYKKQGRFKESLRSYETGHELGSQRKGWPYPSATWVSGMKRLVELEARFLDGGNGSATPNDADDCLVLADLCYKTGRHASAARFAEQAFVLKPGLAEDLSKGYRYNAACSAILAGSGQGKDEPKPDDAARIKLLEQGMKWLRADLGTLERFHEAQSDPARKVAVPQMLGQWLVDPDTASTRGEDALGRLPESVRDGFRSLWADAAALRARAVQNR